MNRGKALATVAIALVAVAGAAGVGAAVQKDVPTRKARGQAAKAPSLEGAIAELKREYAAYVKDPDAAPLRSECDYFIDHPQTVTPGAVLAVLEKPMPGDSRLAAYVKWQLLSGLPDELDPATVQRLVKVYQKAPMPAPRYGFTTREKRKLDAAVAGARPQDDVQLTAKLEEAVERGYGADAPITAYRDELYRRLPVGRDKFFAGLRDATERMSVAAQKWELMELLVEELQGWALSGDATQPQVREMAELVGRLRFVESPPYYASAGVRKGKVAWVKKNDTLFSKRKLADLHKLLLEAAGMAPPADAAAADDDKANGNAGKAAPRGAAADPDADAAAPGDAGDADDDSEDDVKDKKTGTDS